MTRVWSKLAPAVAIVLLQFHSGLALFAYARVHEIGFGIANMIGLTVIGLSLLFNHGISRRAMKADALAFWRLCKTGAILLLGVSLLSLVQQEPWPSDMGPVFVASIAILWSLVLTCYILNLSVMGDKISKEEQHACPQTQSFSLLASLGSMCAMALVGAAILLGGGAGFVNIPALVITCGTTSFLLLGVYRTDFLRFIPNAVAALFTVSREPQPLFADIAKTGSRFIIGTGVLGTLIGFIQMLRELDDPSAIGLGLAVSFLTSLYAIFMAEIVFAYLYKVYSIPASGDCRKSVSPAQPAGTLPLRNLGIPVILLAWILTVFFVMMMSFTNMECHRPPASAWETPWREPPVTDAQWDEQE